MGPNDSTIPADVLADLQAVADALVAGRPVDPEVARRVRERSERASQEVLQRQGPLTIAVDLVREGRDEE